MSYPDVDHGETTILIGYDVFEAHIQKEIRHPPVGVQDPFAVLFPLGLSLCRPVFEMSKRSRSIFCISRDELLQHVEKFIERESSGTRPAQPPKLTPEKERAVRMVPESTQLVNGRFEAGLPWVSWGAISSSPTIGKLQTNFLIILRKASPKETHRT